VHQLPLLVVGSYRPVPRPPELTRLVASLGANGIRMNLGPLLPESVLELAGGLLSARLAPNLARRAAGAAGNPLFVQELLDALVTAGAIIVDAQGQAEVAVDALPSSLAATILQRMSDLPPETVTFCRSPPCSDLAFPLADLAVLSGRSTVDLLAALRPALTSGVLGDTGSQLAFRHELLREPALRGHAAGRSTSVASGPCPRTGGRGSRARGRALSAVC
jgi:predicted ATPase